MAAKRSDRLETERILTFESVVAELLPFIDTPFTLEVQLGQTQMTIRDLLDLDRGSVVELKRSAGEPMDVLCKGKVIMR
ncbi:MAG: FliM/FliN family flagellar motor switch protein, partial [Firmicutes bacterium]|nr:FliM/FliN family flagellar motor switch protein [Bacillota bacterium]